MKFVVKLFADDQKPSITCPSDEEVMSSSAPVTYEDPTVSDNSGNVPTYTCTPDAETLQVGQNTITCTATDGSGNAESCSYDITVIGR